MKNTILATWVINMQADIAAKQFDGGYIELYGDEEPTDPDLDHLPHEPIAVFKLNSPAFSPASFGEIRLFPVAPAIVTTPGRIKWARGLSASRKTLVDLGVGLHEQTGNIVLSKLDVRIGQELVMLSWIHRVAASTKGC